MQRTRWVWAVLFAATARWVAADPGAGPPAGGSPAGAATSPAVPRPESLRDLRTRVAAGKLGGTPDLCDRLATAYGQSRDAELAQNQVQGYVDSVMVGYCLYAKAQVLTLTKDFSGASAALAAARAYQTAHAETKLPKVLPLFQELDAVTSGLLLEKQGRLDDAVQAYLPAHESGKATSRLAGIAFARGQPDQARAWANPHADDPTSQWVLARLALKANNGPLAYTHAARAAGLLQRALGTGSEYMPVYYCEAPAIFALRRSLQRFAPKPAAAPAPPAKPPAPPAAAGTPP